MRDGKETLISILLVTLAFLLIPTHAATLRGTTDTTTTMMVRKGMSDDTQRGEI